MARRALITLPEGVWRVVDEMKGTVGDGDSEVIRNIVIAHLSEKGLLIPSYRIRGIASPTQRDTNGQEEQLHGLVKLLERKGVISRNELARETGQRPR